MASYIRAMEILYAEVNHPGHSLGGNREVKHPFFLGKSSVRVPIPFRGTLKADFRKKQAESMFKVDFFEFYALLERYITLSLSILGVSISASAPRTNVNALRFLTNPDFARSRIEASHQYHANLLEALDDSSNPLHNALGTQDVRIQLGLAKDYRNRWKDADEKLTQWASEEEIRRRVNLGDLELEKMLQIILSGCDHALNIVHGKRDSPSYESAYTSRDIEPDGYSAYDTMEVDDTPLEYMDDAMDLDDML